MTLDKRITEFVQDHPGNWQIMAGTAQLRLPSSVLYVSVYNDRLIFGVNFTGGSSQSVHRDQLLERLARWEGRWIAERGRMVDCYPPWLVEPVRVELRRRADELLTLAGEPILSERLAASMAAQSINPEREALQDARTALRCSDDIIMTREELIGLVANLRQILEVTPTPLEKYMSGPAPRCFNEGRDAMICARDEAQADGDHERAAWLQARLDSEWRDPAPQTRRILGVIQ